MSKSLTAQAPATIDSARLLQESLSQRLLGERLSIDFYARNGFRLLAAPAWLDPAALTTQCQQFRNAAKLGASRLRRNTIQTIPDGHLSPETLLSSVAKLENPRHRFSAELFWPHLPAKQFERIRAMGRLGAEELLKELAPNGKTPLAHAHYVHLTALVHHCLAIESELQLLQNPSLPPPNHWQVAIDNWRQLCSNDEFWNYMRERAAQMDDPRLRVEDVDQARRELPGLILAFNELLIVHYADKEDYAQCVRHLAFITKSGFPEETTREAMLNAVKKVAGVRLEDLCRQAKLSFDDIKEDVQRGAFAAIVDPLLQGAQEIRSMLTARLGLPASTLEGSAFDDIAQVILDATEQKLRYKDDERERNILYSGQLAKRLLKLPLSPQVRRRAERSIHDNDRFLYEKFGLEAGALPHATECFFLAGADADPDESLIIPIYRITNRIVKVDKTKGTAWPHLYWETYRLLIPRSREAKPAHGSTVEIPLPTSEYTPQQHSAAAQLKTMEADHQAFRGELKKRAAAEVESAKKREAQTSETSEKAFAVRIKNEEAAISVLGKQNQEKIAANTSKLNSSKNAVKANYAAALEQARNEQRRVMQQTSSYALALKLELPLAIVMVIAAYLAFGASTTAPTIGAILALVCGRVVRDAMLKRSTGRLKEAEEAMAKDLKTCEKSAEAERAEIQQQFTKKKNEHDAAIAAIKKEAADLAKAAERRIAAIQAEWNNKIAKADGDYELRAKPVKAQLFRSGPVKALARQREFPAYKSALLKGFKEGVKPDAEDWKLTPSEFAEALIKLRQ